MIKTINGCSLITKHLLSFIFFFFNPTLTTSETLIGNEEKGEVEGEQAGGGVCQGGREGGRRGPAWP